MSTPSAVPRTAPIAIAPKPPKFPPSRQGSINLDSYRDGRSGFDSPDSDSPLYGKSVPCEACMLRRIPCVMSDDDDDSCISCQNNGAECSLAESPQARKRKLNNGNVAGSRSKRR